MMNWGSIKLSLRKNDQVQVIAGKEKGKTGKILKVDSKYGRVIVEHLNLVKRHMKASRTTSAGIIDKESPIHYSNVLLLCSKCNRGVRHGYKMVQNAKGKMEKTRICKRCGESLDVA